MTDHAIQFTEGIGGKYALMKSGPDVTEIPTEIPCHMPVTAAGDLIDPTVSTLTEYNVTLTNVDTQYSQALPVNCKGFEFISRGGYAVRWSLVTGKVATPTAPYNTLKAGAGYEKRGLKLASATIYFASDNAGDVVELIAES